MAVYNGNDVFLAINGLNVSAWYTDEVTYTENRNQQDTTAGAGSVGVKRQDGLLDCALELMLVHDKDDWNRYKSVFQGGPKTVIYGPEGSGTGKPRFECIMSIESITHGVSIEKTKVAHTVSFVQREDPTATVYLQGSTFS